jgi:adenylyltransferase/sulfurtransferase
MNEGLTVIVLWDGRFDRLSVARRTDPPCPTCVEGKFPYLAGEGASRATTLCGRNSVQVSAAPGARLDLAALAARLAALGEVQSNRFLVRARVEGFDLTVFGDGRALVTGTKDGERARALYARYVGT